MTRQVHSEIKIPDALRKCVIAIGIRDYNYNEHTKEQSVNIIFKGSGVLVFDERYILITAKHVVFDKNGEVFPNLCFWGNKKNGEPFVRSFSEIQEKYKKIKWVADPNNDIAASVVELDISKESLGLVTRDGFAKMKDIDIGNDIYYLGYPAKIGAIHDSKPVVKNEPVLRGGMVALKEKDYFYIDAVVAGGNSGGPVFLNQKEKPITLLGIVCAFPKFITKELRVYHTGLGIVFSTDSIGELLDSPEFKSTF
jgi:V8-like Glu-specific endopeptidase